jgi:CheY-like chemotaxis protein/DNA-binding XRE family transcriptional regulator
MTQEALAERADLHRTYITEIECGVRNVTLKCVEKLALALQVPSETLLFDGGSSGGESPAGNRVDILLVEDNRADVELTLHTFKKARMSNAVQMVHDGEEALNFLFCTGNFAPRRAQGLPQLVLLDLYLPKVNGLEVLRRIKSDRRTQSIPVIVLTGSQSSRDIAQCLRLGAETHIVKPVNFRSLSQATPRLNLDWTLLRAKE